jgi:hypothetical protein
MNRTKQTLIAIAISMMTIGANPAFAQAVCEPLTPEAIDSINIVLDEARAAADAAAISAGYDKDSPSTYPNALIARAKAQWHATYLQWFPANSFVPYINASNVALALDGGPNIEVNTALVNARWWSSALAYNYSIVQPSISANYLVVRQKVQAAMTQMDKLGYSGARCGILMSAPGLASLMP